MEKQLIISISREYGSAGHDIAENIAREMNLKFYDRNMLDEIAKSKNVQIDNLKKYDEKPRNIFNSRKVGSFTNSYEQIIAEMQFDYIREKANAGESFVIVGRCSETVLKGNEALISIFILGDKEVKLKRIMDKFNLNESDAAAKIKRHDRNRKQYHNHYSDGKWGDSRLYDMCINSSRLGIDKTTAVIRHFIEERKSVK